MSLVKEDDLWRGACYQARREHERQMTVLASGEWPAKTTQTKSVKVLMFRPDQCEWLSVVKDSWVQAVEYYAEEARGQGGVAIGAIMVGVMPEQEQGKLHLKPSLITVVTGVGVCEGRRFDISHRFEEQQEAMVFYGPLSIDGQGTLNTTGWNVENGMEGVLIGPWPKRLPRPSVFGGEALTE